VSGIRQGQAYWLEFGPAAGSAPADRHLKKGDAGLPKASVVNVSQILTVDKAELVECVGKLSAAAIGAVCDGLHMLFGRL